MTENSTPPASADEGKRSKRKLERISIEGADNGIVVTKHKRMSDRVKAMGHEDLKPETHVFTDHAEAAKHIADNLPRLG